MVNLCRASSISWLSSDLSAFTRELLSSIMEIAIFKSISSSRQLDEARSVNERNCVAVFIYLVNVFSLKGTLKGLLLMVLEHKFQYCDRQSSSKGSLFC